MISYVMQEGYELDVGEHPGLDAELYRSSDGGSEHLSPEHRARGNFHVMTQFEVRREDQSLVHGTRDEMNEHRLQA